MNLITKCCLEHRLANPGWRSLFRYLQVLHFPLLTSNHIPIIFQVIQAPEQNCHKHKHFHFEEAWLQREDCTQVVATGWSKQVFRTSFFRVCDKIKVARVELLKWKRSLASFQNEIKVVCDQLKVLFQHPLDSVKWDLGSNLHVSLSLC